ncbi:MAG: helix-turn-helix domain-containing protein [Pseudomonadota bacterium]|nr:helix-turn-helix domain-containing protein [Pseudomonadota bacterium]
MNAQVQIIEKNGKPEYAVMPIEQYFRLLELAEEMEDIQAYDAAMAELKAGGDELIPADVANRLLSGEAHPLRIWREYRDLTQQALAEKIGVGKSYISQIESGQKPGSVTVLKKIAVALNVELDDLVD